MFNVKLHLCSGEKYFYKDSGSAVIEFTPQVLKIYIASAENLKFTSQVQKIYRTSEASAVNFLHL